MSWIKRNVRPLLLGNLYQVFGNDGPGEGGAQEIVLIFCDLEDPANEPKYDEPGFLEMSVSPFQAPDVPACVTLDFEKLAMMGRAKAVPRR